MFVIITGFDEETTTENPTLVIENVENGDQLTITQDGLYSMNQIAIGSYYEIIQSDESNVDSNFICTAPNNIGTAAIPYVHITFVCTSSSNIQFFYSDFAIYF